MYVCMYVCMYVYHHVCMDVCMHKHRKAPALLDLGRLFLRGCNGHLLVGQLGQEEPVRRGRYKKQRLCWAGLGLLRTRLPLGRTCCKGLRQLSEPPKTRKATTPSKLICTMKHAGLFCNSSSTCNQSPDKVNEPCTSKRPQLR